MILRVFGYMILTAFIFVVGFTLGSIGALALVDAIYRSR